MRIALFVIIIFCGFIVDKLGMPDFLGGGLVGLGSVSLFMNYLEAKEKRK